MAFQGATASGSISSTKKAGKSIEGVKNVALVKLIEESQRLEKEKLLSKQNLVIKAAPKENKEKIVTATTPAKKSLFSILLNSLLGKSNVSIPKTTFDQERAKYLAANPQEAVKNKIKLAGEQALNYQLENTNLKERAKAAGLTSKQESWSTGSKDLAKDILRSVPRAGASMMMELPAGIMSLTQGKEVKAEWQPESKFEKFLFGKEPIKGIGLRTTESQKKIQTYGGDNPFLTGASLALAPLGVTASTALDLTPGGGEKKAAEKALAEIAGSKSSKFILGKLKTLIKGSDSELKSLADDLVNVSDKKIVEKLIKEQTNLSPLVAEAKKYKMVEEFVKPKTNTTEKLAEEYIPEIKNKYTDATKQQMVDDIIKTQKLPLKKEVYDDIIELEDNIKYLKSLDELTPLQRGSLKAKQNRIRDYLIKDIYRDKSIAVLPEKPINLNAKTVKEAIPTKPSLQGGRVEQVFRTDKLDVTDAEIIKLEKMREDLGLKTRDVRSFDTMKETAEELGVDPVKLIKDANKNRITDSEVIALRNTISSNSKFITDSEKILGGEQALSMTKGEIEIMKMKMEAATNQINDALTKLIKGGTEAGRTVVAFKILANRTMEPSYWLAKAQKLKGKELVKEEIDAITKLAGSGDKLGLIQEVMRLRKSTFGEKAITLWKAGLLTSPTTHIANIGGNVTMTLLENIAKQPAAAVDALVSLFTKKRTKTFTAIKDIVERAKGSKKGVQEALKYLKTGASEAEMLKWDIPKKVVFKNKIANGYTETVFRGLGAEDKVFKETAFRGSLFEQAQTAVKNQDDAYKKAVEVLTGEGKEVNKKNLLNYLVENPTDDMTMMAINDAEYVTFQSKNVLADIISGAKRGAGSKKWIIDVVAPFTKTPSNVAARIVDYTPAGIVKTIYEAFKADGLFKGGGLVAQKAFSEGFGRAMTGSMVMAFGAYLGAKGLITSDYPTDANEKFLWEQEGKQPNSILINGKWRSMSKISPVGNLLALGANIAKYKSEGKKGADLVTTSASSAVKGLTEMTFLQGVSGMLQALTQPDRGAEKYGEQLVASMTPTLIGKITRIIDPIKREQTKWYQGAQAKIPGLSQFLPENLDDFGQIQKYENGFAGWRQLFDPFTSTTAKSSPVISELRRLKDAEYPAKPTAIDAKTSLQGVKIELSPEELNVIKSNIGNAELGVLNEIVQSPDYQAMTDAEKQKTLRNVMGDIKEKVMNANPKFGTWILRRDGAKITEEVQEPLNAIMNEIIMSTDKQTKAEWKAMSDDKKVELVKKIQKKLIEKEVSKTINELR